MLPWTARKKYMLVAVGVWLLRDSIDIAEPGRGVGLGLGGASESASELGVSTISSCVALLAPDTESSDAPSALSDEYVGASTRYDSAPSPLTTATEESKRSSFRAEPEERLKEDRTRGLRPLSSTFFRALMPTQSASCFIASRSETARRGAVRRMVLARGRVS